MTTPDPTSVYLYFDSAGILIYVGITSRGINRQREHEKSKPWWGFTNRQEIEHYSSRAEALNREKFLISTYCPPFNTQHNPNMGAMDAYLRLASADGQDSPIGRSRIPLRVAVSEDKLLIAVTENQHAEIAKTIMPVGDFDISLPQGRSKEVKFKRVGSTLAVMVKGTMAMSPTSGTLMYRTQKFGRDIKRIDFE